MITTTPSKELEKWIIYELDNIHLKENTPEYLLKEFNEIFFEDVLVIE